MSGSSKKATRSLGALERILEMAACRTGNSVRAQVCMVSTFLPEGWMARLSAWLIFSITEIWMESTFLPEGWIVRLNAWLVFNFKLSWMGSTILPKGWIIRFIAFQWYSAGRVTGVSLQLLFN